MGDVFSGEVTTVWDVDGGVGSWDGCLALALALPPIMPSFPVRFGLAVAGAEDVGRTWSLFPPSSGEFGCSLGFSGEGAGSGSFSFFFLPPITPNPPLGFFGASRALGGGEAGAAGSDSGSGSGSAGLLGIRLLRGAGAGSGSGSVSDAVASSASDGPGGDGLFFLAFGLGEGTDFLTC